MKILIEVQLKDIVNNARVFGTLNNSSFRARTAYKIALLFKELQNQLDSYNSVRKGLLEKYGELTSTGQYTVEKEKLSDFSAEHNELLNEQVQLNCNKININELEDVELTTEQMTALLPFIEG